MLWRRCGIMVATGDPTWSLSCQHTYARHQYWTLSYRQIGWHQYYWNILVQTTWHQYWSYLINLWTDVSIGLSGFIRNKYITINGHNGKDLKRKLKRNFVQSLHLTMGAATSSCYTLFYRKYKQRIFCILFIVESRLSRLHCDM